MAGQGGHAPRRRRAAAPAPARHTGQRCATAAQSRRNRARGRASRRVIAAPRPGRGGHPASQVQPARPPGRPDRRRPPAHRAITVRPSSIPVTSSRRPTAALRYQMASMASRKAVRSPAQRFRSRLHRHGADADPDHAGQDGQEDGVDLLGAHQLEPAVHEVDVEGLPEVGGPAVEEGQQVGAPVEQEAVEVEGLVEVALGVHREGQGPARGLHQEPPAQPEGQQQGAPQGQAPAQRGASPRRPPCAGRRPSRAPAAIQ